MAALRHFGFGCRNAVQGVSLLSSLQPSCLCSCTPNGQHVHHRTCTAVKCEMNRTPLAKKAHRRPQLHLSPIPTPMVGMLVGQPSIVCRGLAMRACVQQHGLMTLSPPLPVVDDVRDSITRPECNSTWQHACVSAVCLHAA